jgi:hypothetical protein
VNVAEQALRFAVRKCSAPRRSEQAIQRARALAT